MKVPVVMVEDAWKELDCEQCFYRIQSTCRLNPPSSLGYPKVADKGVFRQACSHYSIQVGEVVDASPK